MWKMWATHARMNPCSASQILSLRIASARGAFYGLSPSHGIPHLARALLEGLSFAMRDVLDRVRELGVECQALRIVGGGARSSLWTQMRADLAGLPAETPRHVDTSAIGAAHRAMRDARCARADGASKWRRADTP